MKKTLAIILSVFILFSILPVIPFTASAIAIEETYYDYDEIDYSDLLLSGDHLAMETAINGSKTFTYNRTSPTGSVILRYRWTVGSVAKFQLSFEKTASNAMAYMFGAWLSEPSAEANYPNGRMWLRPGYGPPVAIENVIEPGTDHDIELARLKVANGSNKGKYYVYIKIDGELIAEDYVVASIVDADLNYYSKPNEVLCSIPSNEIFFAFWGSENNKISSASAKYSGTCDDNLTWQYDTSTYTLTISGTGAMNYSASDYAPWRSNSAMKRVVVNTGVTSIGSYAFSGCTGLTSITIPDSVTSIGSYAFSGCTGLTSITIPDSVTSIGGNAFKGCTGLTSITIPDGVTSIGWYAFCYCTALTSITIPDSVTSIGERAFSDCRLLTSVTIGNSVTSIGDYAFYGCTGLTSITIPDSVTSIGNSAFRGCTGLTSVTIGNGVTSIGDSAFYGCTKLNMVNYTGSIADWCNISFDTFDSYEANPLCHAHNLYINDELITNLIIPDSVTSIGDSAFSGCTGITSVTIGDGVTYIGSYAFSGCTGLTSITIPDSVTSIGYSAFSGCTGLTSVTLGSGLTSIGVLAFYGCTGLTSITIPDSVTSIGSSAFNGCTELTSITIPDSVTSIGSYAFNGCTGLTSITIPDSVTSIGSYAFRGCTGLTSITIPDSVTSIGEYAFQVCTGLTSIVIGNGVTSIGFGAFSGCTGLTSITIPDSVTSTGYYAFSGCTGLTSVTIPDSVTSMGNFAFYGCTGLKSAGPIGTGCNYEFGWTDRIPNGTFSGYTWLKSITIPDSVTSIGSSAFSGCTGLKSITIPDSVTSIGSYAFYNCTGLTSVILGSGLTSIGASAFSGCTGLTSITIPDSVTEICSGAFGNCTELTDIYYAGTEQQKANISIESDNNPLTNANWHYLTLLNVKSATCTETGYTGNMGWEYNGEVVLYGEVILPLGHDYVPIVTPPTCTAQGYTTYTCSRCNDSYIVDYVYMPCGENCGFIINGNTLYIHGSGETDNYKTQTFVPWYDYADSITEIVIDAGITKIGNYAFYCLENLKSIKSKNSDLSFGKYTINDSNVNITVFAENGGNIETYCAENNINYIDPTTTPEIETVTDNSITVKAVAGYEYSLDGTVWQKSNKFTGFLAASEHTIYARYADTADMFDTVGTPLVVTTLKSTVTAPAAPDYQSHTDNSITLAPNGLYEYSKDGKNWQKSSEFTGLSKNTVYRFYQRVAETETEYASKPSAALIIAIPDKPVILEAGYDSILIKLVDGFEYCLDDFVWQDNNSFDKLIDNTEYYVYQRLKAVEGEKVYGITSEYTAVTTDNGIAHTHTVIDWLTEESPTCIEKGIESGICTDCGKTVTRDIEALGHTGGTATCHSKAICERCHEEYGEVNPANHDGETEVRDAVAANCTAAGYTGDTYCLGCGTKTATGEEIAALGHSFTNYVSGGNATCTADGTKTAKCERCDATDTVADVDSKLGHDYKAAVTDPTCTEQGYTTHTCSRCQDSYVDTYLDALGHKVAEWECGDSTHWHICTTCGEKLDEAEHSASDWIIDREASMQITGEKHKECTVCGKTLETETIPKLYTPGDINGDEAVNNKDLTRLFQYLSDWDVEVNEAALDINGDGTVNNKDLTRLFQYLSDWDVEIF